jgi:NADH-ubiquinone oxidoreductase chain 5
MCFAVLTVWDRLIKVELFRNVYEFINQKWYFDVIYFNFVVTPIMNFSYYISFKLIDRGVLEFAGSLSLTQNLYLATRVLNFYESGYLYAYSFIQLLSVILVLITIFS